MNQEMHECRTSPSPVAGGNNIVAEESIEDKVKHLQNCLDLFRAEVDVKMQIMDQILNTRNEQFVMQKKLIEKEHAMFENVLSCWRSTGEFLAAGPLPTQFATNPHESYFVTPNRYSNSAKRSSSSAAFGTESERTRIRAKRLRCSASSPGSSFISKSETVAVERTQDSGWQESLHLDDDTDDSQGSNDDTMDTEMEQNSGESDDAEHDTENIGSGMEKRVFVNFYSVDCTNPEESSSDPIWIHFLHEEKGSTALCKHCDEKGFQQIYKLRTPSMAILRKHLKKKHKIVVEAPLVPIPEVVEAPERDGRRRLMPFLRHNDHLYTRYTHRNSTEYWRCREKTCSGKLVKRPGYIQCTAEHNCLTTPADCEAILFREKIRELAETEPTLPPSDVIAAAKLGVTDDVLELVPNDESLRRTIRRIRQALESAAPSTSDWM